MAQKQKAPESTHIKKARQKLKRIMETEAKEFNTERLEKMADVMRQWINRYAGERTPLSEKNIELFDQNKHAARTASNYVKELRSKLRQTLGTGESAEEGAPAMASLKGRISQPGSES